MALLEVTGLTGYYGVIQALKGIDFTVDEGEIVTLIGANGAGKTTTMQSVMGLIPAQGGKVVYDGQDITKTPCHKIVHMGMTQVPEGRRVFSELTVHENLLMGAYANKDKARSAATSTRSASASPVWASAAIRAPARSRAASSRCWPWDAP